MADRMSQRLTAEFYRWEIRGRGWQLWDAPVELEPPFRPFFCHAPPARPVIDDGLKPTFLGTLARKLIGGASDVPVEPALHNDSLEPDIFEPGPEWFADDSKLIEIQVVLPPGLRIDSEAAMQFLAAIRYCDRPVSFEIVGRQDHVIVQFA